MGKTFPSPAICFFLIAGSRAHEVIRAFPIVAEEMLRWQMRYYRDMEALFCICFDSINLRHDRFFSLDRLSWKGTESASSDGDFFKKTVSCKQVYMAVCPF